MWDDAAKAIMRVAAIKAGLITADDPPDKLILTSEPEAAALDCEQNQTEGSLQDEDVIFICDAGGGTIDLTVYKVHYKDGEKRFEELTRGEGKSCGSSFIDDLARLWFKGHLEHIFGIASVKSHELDDMTLQFSTEQKVSLIPFMIYHLLISC
jgi:molecular chaperone DnaK (HSP70)